MPMEYWFHSKGGEQMCPQYGTVGVNSMICKDIWNQIFYLRLSGVIGVGLNPFVCFAFVAFDLFKSIFVFNAFPYIFALLLNLMYVYSFFVNAISHLPKKTYSDKEFLRFGYGEIKKSFKRLNHHIPKSWPVGEPLNCHKRTFDR